MSDFLYRQNFEALGVGEQANLTGLTLGKALMSRRTRTEK